jgi:alcohol dehydrogenase (cytochrome c)
VKSLLRLLLVLFALTARAASADELPAVPLVDDARLLDAQHDDGSLMYRRAYDSQGFAPFAQIDASNASQLRQVFSYSTGLPQGHEAAPLVNGHTLYLTTPMDHVVALDATSGRVLWTYVHTFAPKTLRTVCCDVVNRGLAIYGRLVYLATLDDHVVALDAQTGAVVWNKTVAETGIGYAMTSAPLVVGGRLIVGISGGEFGAPGFMCAFDARTGAELWKTRTVPAANEPGSETWPAGKPARGAGPWLTGSYDPATDTLFWGTGNPSPWRADVRRGKNLFSDSVLALDPKTGKLKWYFQFTPNDEWDYDGVNENVLADVTRGGKLVHALFHADRNGQFIVLDRTSGRFIYSTPLVKSTAVLGYDANGSARIDPAARLHGDAPVSVCPSSIGGKNWWPAAYNPALGLAYVPLSHMCMSMTSTALEDRVGAPYLGVLSRLVPEPGSPGFGEVVALDVATGARVWSHPSALPWNDGMLATAGNLVFSGSADGHFYAFDARDGSVLWSAKTDSGIIGVPIAYRIDGKEFIAVLAGWGGGVALFGGPAATATQNIPRGGQLYVFSLP